jgi:hypothetical protein
MIVRCEGSHVLLDNAHTDGGEVVSLMLRPAVLYTQTYSGHSFLLDAESTRG